MNSIIEELLSPISAEQPCGANPKLDNNFSNPYYQLKSLRQQARIAEKNREQQSEVDIIVPSEWRDVASLAIKIIKDQTKDLEVVCWLVEAWVRINSFSGLIDGFNLFTKLNQTFGPEFLKYSAEDIEQQLSTAQGLSGAEQPGTLVMPLLSQPITQTSNERGYPTWQYQQAKDIANLKDEEEKSKRLKQGGVELKKIEQAAKITSEEFKTTLKNNLNTAFQELNTCDEAFRATFAQQAPVWSYLKQALEKISHAVGLLYPEDNTAASPENSEAAEEETSAPTQSGGAGSFQKRDEVLKAISSAADYFLQTEPHSPIIYLLQQSVRWATLSLPELMQEILQNADAYYAYCRTTGIPVTQDGQDG